MAQLKKSLVIAFCLTILLAAAHTATAADPRKATVPAGASAPVYTPDTEAILFSESFEISVPPPTWSLVNTHTGTETWYQSTFNPYDGVASANCEWDPDLIPQDEWLVSPAYDLAAGTGSISLWSLGSLYWCRDNFDNCDLNIYLVVGAPGGGDDVMVGMADPSWIASYEWAQTSFDISGSLPINASVGLNYNGTDGATIAADLVVLDGTLIPVELMRISVE
jgi:hypothetical protein